MIAYADITSLSVKFITLADAFIRAIAGFLEAKQGSSDVCLSAIDVLNRAKLTGEEMKDREDRVMTNERLSSIGRVAELKQITKEYAPKFSFVRESCDTRQAAAAELRAQLMAVPKPATGDAHLNYQIEREVRERLVKLPLSERMTKVSDAARRGDWLPLRSIENDPLREALLPSEFVERPNVELAQQKDSGKRWVRLTSLEFCAERLNQLATVIETELAHYDHIPAFQGKDTRTTNLHFQDTQAAPPKSQADAPVENPPRFQ